MSIDDLVKLNKSLDIEPPAITFPASDKELIGKRENVEAIVAQKIIEDRFNAEINSFNVAPMVIGPADPAGPPGEQAYRGVTLEGFIEDAAFALDYSARLTRSAMAVSGISAEFERFGDIRKSQGFWIAMADFIFPKTVPFSGTLTGRESDLLERTGKLTKKVPGVLKDPSVPLKTLPGFGAIATAVGYPEQMEWIFDVIGELVIEQQALRGVRTLAQKGMTKLTKDAYKAGEKIVKKKGIGRILGQLDDDELRAIDEAVKTRRFGKLGTKPAPDEIDDAVRRTFEYIEESKPSQLVKKEVISAKRKKAAAKMYDIQGDNYGQGYAARLRKAGTIEATDKAYTPLLQVSDKAASDEIVLQKVIDNFDFGGSKIYTEANVQGSIAKLYEYGELLTPGEVSGLRDVFGDAFANSLDKFIRKPVGVAGKTFDFARKGLRGLSDTARTLMTTGELSFLMRQGNYRAWSRPKDAMRSFAVALRSLVSPEYAARLDDAIRFSKAGRIGTKRGLFLGKFIEGRSLKEAEEVFMADWLNRVPVLGRFKKSFERGYVNGLNQIRIDWFDEGLQLLEHAGKAGDDELVSKWATYVNNMTGRADLDNIKDANLAMKKMAETAKDVLFAPRFAASKWNRHKVAAEIMFGADTPNAMRRLLATDTIKKWRRYERLANYASQNGFEVEKDPRSSDYLKLKIGDTRFDVLGGDTQIMVLMARLASGQTKDTATGLLKDNISTKLAQQYLEGKLNPLWSLIFDEISGETFEGEDIDDPKVLAKVIRNRFIPLYFQDVSDKMFAEYEQEGKGLAEAIDGSSSTIALGFLGAGIQTFEPSARKEYELMVNDKAQELYAKNFDELPVYLKEEIVWEAENDDIDKTELLKEEMGMQQQTRASVSRRTKRANQSFRDIRKGLGKDYQLFQDSNVSVGHFTLTIGDVKLNTEQFNTLHQFYIRNIKDSLGLYPDITQLEAKDWTRRRWLEDIVSNARIDAIEQLRFLGLE